MNSSTPALLAALFVSGFLATQSPLLAVAKPSASPPAGYFTLVARGGADTTLSLPLVRQPVWIGRVSGVVAPNRIQVAGVSALGAGQHDATSAGPACYALFLTGALRGVFYPVATNTTSEITLATAGDDLTAHPLGSLASGAETGDVVRLYPAWTIAEIFGGDAASLALDSTPVAPGPVYLAGDQIRQPDQTTLAVEKRPAAIHAYVADAGWRKYPDGGSSDSGSAPVLPGESLVVRRHRSAEVAVLLVGQVAPPFGVLRLPALAAGEASDVAVGLLRPAPVSLAASGLGAKLTPTPDATTRGDRVLAFEPGERGFSAAATTSWQWTVSGWREGSASADTATLQPGQGYLLRLRGPRAVSFWAQPAAEAASAP